MQRTMLRARRKGVQMRGIVGVLVALVAVLAAGASGATGAAAQETERTDAFEPADCPVTLPPGVSEPDDVECGFVTVPVRHDEPEGATLRLAVAIIAAEGEPTGDPLLSLAGGPGEAQLLALALFADPDSPLRRLGDDRDVVLIDQRGVGFSEPALECPEANEVPRTDDPDADLAASIDAVADCHDRLADAGIDLAAFNTLENAADLDAARAALGYEQMHLWGTSYGARLALEASRLTPDSWSSQVIDSPYPAEADIVADVGPGFAQSLDRLAAECAADPACARAHPDLAETIDRVVAALADEPAAVTVTDPQTGERRSLPITARLVAQLVFNSFYVTPLIGEVPAVVYLLEAEEYERLFDEPPPADEPPARAHPAAAEASDNPHVAATDVFERLEPVVPEADEARVAAQQAEDAPSPFALGMNLAFACNEWAPVTSAEAIADATAGLPAVVADHFVPYALNTGPALLEVCDRWDTTEPAADALFEPVDTDVETLVVVGDYDHITTPAYGEQIAEALPHASLVTAGATGHSPVLGLGECGLGLVTDWLAAPGSPPDAGCATEHQTSFVIDTPAASARDLDRACPPADVPADRFDDVPDDFVHAAAVDCVAWWEVALGVSADAYAPARDVTRGQMASFVARLIIESGGELADDPPSPFTDTADSPHAGDIDRIVDAGVVSGRGDGTFAPDAPVARGHMATFAVGAAELRRNDELPPGLPYFSDDDNLFDVHAGAIERAARAGIVAGVGERTYDAVGIVRRGQMAAFLARTLDVLVADERAAPPQ